MARLGLSDSMRSTVSIEDTEPLHTASHRRPPRRPLAASIPTTTDASRGVLAIALLSAGVKVLNVAVRISRISSTYTGAQFERLERSVELLGRDTTRLQTTADRFLHSCQEAQVAASTRTLMLHNMAKSRFDEQAKAQIEEHEQVMREVMQYYAQQGQQVLEAKERLIKMNVTLPVQILVRSVPETWQQDEQNFLGDGGDVVDQGDARGRLAGAMKGLSFFAEKALQQDGGDYQRLSVESISIQKVGKLESNSGRMRVEPSTSFFFYIFVVCASAVYLWNAVSDTRKKELLEDKWAWSPVPKALTRLKALLNSVVVIEDLRTPRNKDDEAYSPEHIEHIEF
ncbi:hypothetical protein PC129_g4014 [Phytophthora cactorum]|uniref:Uncharacterized protein n=1 Tax=Phytophthora cactorum TaxID=29920 RepID=A0A8T0ZL70_9STRA|nr:hypothetical protein PC111_g4468 [Phytophthora cactorum]KAG2863130.1 hypothetical protein PC113_g5707 [Phytophthora cactorum]KAG2921060.1 hypothetical protein PC114_g5811 [Phytophthora cactorum]KAG2935696.1 hypothetical protein PC115_g4782 [Phytophthora cactorum]KAG2949270.1 hypothetical protein PC117_g5396 [Phytophthora cactorum]